MAGVLAGEHFRLDLRAAYWLLWRWDKDPGPSILAWRCGGEPIAPILADDCTLKGEIPTTSRSLRLG